MKKLLDMKGWHIGVIGIVCFITFFVNNRTIVPDIMESRNIVTAREMVYDGHWLIPTMNGELRLEKPPLPTWLTAVTEYVAPDDLGLQRGMAGLAALLLVYYFYLFAARVLRIDALVPTLLLCTCYNIILMGRTASWDIYCHAFMMGGIYYLARALRMSGRTWRYFLTAGIFMGLSLMSKGPVSLYALLLPFLMAFFGFFRPSLRQKRWPLAACAVLALAVGTWWYVYVYLFQSDALSAVVQKESGSWLNHNVRPWWYYWKFFLETGVWSLLLLTAIFLPLLDKTRRRSRNYLFSLAWLMLSLLLLSLLPEKKSRYLLPILIPACYAMGSQLALWKRTLRLQPLSRLDVWGFRTNAWLLAVVVALLPLGAWLFLVRPGYLTAGLWTVVALFLLCTAAWLARAAWRLKPMGMLGGVTVLFLAAECFALPYLGNIINNPDMKSIALTRQRTELDGIPFYHNSRDPLRIELVERSHRKIKPLDVTAPMDSPEGILGRLPCAILTHGRAGEELPAAWWERIDTLYIDQYDDNPRPKGNRRHQPFFVYHLTLLKAKE